MEKQTYHPIPILDCVAEIQNTEHIIPQWIRSGEDTRNYINRKRFLEKCN